MGQAKTSNGRGKSTNNPGLRHRKSNGCIRPLPGTLVHGHCRGGRLTKKYFAWRGAKVRCLNPNHVAYARYGGRGIQFYTAWESFAQFDQDVPDPPGPEYSLERIDPRQGYCPGNITWATKEQQARNKTDTVIYQFQDFKGTFPELVERAGVNYHAAYKRFRRMGWSLERAFSTPVRGWSRHTD